MSGEQVLNTRIISRHDTTTNWEAATAEKLLSGEIGVEIIGDGKAKIKVGDSTKSWSELKYVGGDAAKHFQVNSLAEITDTELAVGDTAVVKTAIYEDASNSANNKYSYTGYVWNGTDWAAMDGNYNANNVYFDNDMLVTTQIGYVTLTNGQGTISAKGKNLKQVFEGMFVQPQDPTKTDPSVSVTLAKAGAYEVGTVVTGISYTATFEDGTYSFGPEPTGAAVTSWVVTDTAGGSYKTASSNVNNVTVTDGINFSVTATANYSEGKTPKTNTGSDCTDASKKIAAGSASKTSSSITGFRYHFYCANTSPIELTGSSIRSACGTSSAKRGTSSSFNISVPQDAKQVIIALRNLYLKEVKDSSAMNQDIASAFKKIAGGLSIPGAGSDAGVTYNVYVYAPETKLDAATYAVTTKTSEN